MAKSLIQISVNTQKGDCFAVAGDLLAVGVFSDMPADSVVKKLDKKLGGQIAQLNKLGDFEGKPNTSCLLYGERGIAAKRVMLVGLGKSKEIKPEGLRKAAAMVTSKAVDLKAKSVVLCLHTDVPAAAKIDAVQMGQSLTEGALFGAYRYDEYLSETKRLAAVKATIVDADARTVAQLKKGLAAGKITGTSQNYARTIANRPAM